MERISKEQYYLGIALSVSKRSNCLKRRYGAVIVNNEEIIATGYNGSPRGIRNCCDDGMCNRMCKEHNVGDYSECNSVHAEQNAMISASRKEMIGSTLYLASEESNYSSVSRFENIWMEISDISPCPICMRMIQNAGIERVITREGVIWEKK